jgi:hypothetical protein
MTRSTTFLLLTITAVACKPDLGAPISVITDARLLAVRGVPAEAPPGKAVTYDVLAVDTNGRIADPQVGWAQCHLPRSPADPNAVSAACLAISDDAGPSASFTAAVPMGSALGTDGGSVNVDACQHFGPDAPNDMPGVRPRDPDVTGGYYQPVRAVWHAAPGELTGFALERIRCNLANAPADVTKSFNTMYTLNQNPVIAGLTLEPDGAPTTLFMSGAAAPAAASVPQGQPLTLRLAWTDQTAEQFPVWNLATHTLEQHREALSVSWFTTGGSFGHDSTGRDEQDLTTSTDNLWTPPAVAGPVHLWAVLRDSRGGLDFAEAQVEVAP